MRYCSQRPTCWYWEFALPPVLLYLYNQFTFPIVAEAQIHCISALSTWLKTYNHITPGGLSVQPMYTIFSFAYQRFFNRFCGKQGMSVMCNVRDKDKNQQPRFLRSDNKMQTGNLAIRVFYLSVTFVKFLAAVEVLRSIIRRKCVVIAGWFPPISSST